MTAKINSCKLRSARYLTGIRSYRYLAPLFEVTATPTCASSARD